MWINTWTSHSDYSFSLSTLCTGPIKLREPISALVINTICVYVKKVYG
jgi:hypothetical protein